MKLIVDHSERDKPEEIDMLDHYPIAQVFLQAAKVSEVTVRFYGEDLPREVTWTRP